MVITTPLLPLEPILELLLLTNLEEMSDLTHLGYKALKLKREKCLTRKVDNIISLQELKLLFDIASKLDQDELIKSQFLYELNEAVWSNEQTAPKEFSDYLQACNNFLLEGLQEDILALFDDDGNL